MCEALGERFREADRDRDGAVSAEDLMAWLERRRDDLNKTRPNADIPIPQLLGYGQGRLHLTKSPDELWEPYAVAWPDGSEVVVLPNSQTWRSMGLDGSRSPMRNTVDLSRTQATANRREPASFGRRKATLIGKKISSHGRSPGFPMIRNPWCVYHTMTRSNTVNRVNEKTGDTLLWQTSLPTGAIWNVAAFGSYRTPGGDWLNAQTVIHKGAASPASVFAENRSNCRGVSDLLGNVWEWCLEPRAQGGGLQQASSFS